MSISSKITDLTYTISDIKDSINNKGVVISNTDGFKIYPDAVRAIGQKTTETLKPTIHGVNYYDYNGDLLYVYTPQEFLALSAHPNHPTHTGLTADGWNWTLSDAQTFIRNTCDCLNIGAHYVTTSGKTEIYFTLDAKPGECYYFGIYYRAKRTTTTYSILIDWGDGTTTERTSGINTSFTNVSNWHTFSNTGGTVCIKITATNIIYTVGTNASYTSVFGYAYTQNRFKIVTLQKIFFGENTEITGATMSYWGHRLSEISCPKVDYSNRDVGILGNQFLQNWCLKGIVFPEGVTTFGASALSNACNAKCICLPKTAGTTCGNYTFDNSDCDSIIIAATCTSLGTYTFSGSRHLRRVFINGTLTSIPNYTFNACSALEEVTIPDTVSTLGTSAFYECLSLKHLEFSDAITSIGQNCFNYCSSLKTIIFNSTTPPTAGATPFGNCTSLEKIYVPYSADHSILEAYQTATNWTTYASKIYELDSNGNIPT